ncbi:hydantoinase B/oxoprolinase family protein [Catenovulum sp. SM1970]|uniref:hydantoinase B/oxoprolinase family protein n=1 Tax=Marinifaba aquimaris TaxID=2741323 RepID=UPI0015737607|nr:hydantoinase B/oxoprolinase family protein [Marinifaba aquimaris]NTS78098.1 hydantoinase B/oxoprolinase family protein [Marinifaba aquimaris]
MKAGWRFWVDRGGTFTDIIALNPEGQYITHKLLSENPKHYENSAIQGIRDCLGLSYEQAIPCQLLSEVKVGTTVATNALLERKGEPTALITTKGFADALAISQQHRPDIFALDIKLAERLYGQVVEINERINADGEVLAKLDVEQARFSLKALRETGINAVAIVLVHAWKNPQHELALELLAKEAGFSQVSVSHQVSPTIKYVPRGDTTVVDAYLTPVMRRYVDFIAEQLPDVPLYFMQSNGGLAKGSQFCGKDAILSGPAGGIVGAVKSAQQIGFDKVVGFDMGGTSTDVSHYANDNGNSDFERVFDTQVAGIKLAVPMMHIHTVAAGGGSICYYQDGRLQVGPESAGAYPGPACYRNGGPLTVTDCNLILGKLHPELFPKVFGEYADQALDKSASLDKIKQVQDTLKLDNIELTIEAIAAGFIEIAVDSMANAVKKISSARGYQLDDYSLVSFGGAGGQHACLIAEQLGIQRVLIHPYAGVLSAYGIGLADQVLLKEKTLQTPLVTCELAEIKQDVDAFYQQVKSDFFEQNKALIDTLKGEGNGTLPVQSKIIALVKYQGAEIRIEIDWPTDQDWQTSSNDFILKQLAQAFEDKHIKEFGYRSEQGLLLDAVVVQVKLLNTQTARTTRVEPVENTDVGDEISIYTQGRFKPTQTVYRHQLKLGDVVVGPAIIVEKTGTNVVEDGWQAEVIAQAQLALTPVRKLSVSLTKQFDLTPIRLEVFNNLFMSIAEQMGVTLAKTAHSVNIRERMDFSCALFDQNGELVANAPHVPVHLGSMSHSVKSLIKKQRNEFKAGEAYLLNSPYHGGTHLPDLTLISPVFSQGSSKADFFVASRAHHADVGGITPGSMPANSQSIEQEGLLFEGEKIASEGQFDVSLLEQLFMQATYPARNFTQNLADLSAQLAANKQGAQALVDLTEKYGVNNVHTVMQAVQDNAELAVRNAISKLKSGHFNLPLDNQAYIDVDVQVDQQSKTVVLDFSQSSDQDVANFNAPQSVTFAAVIYVFRCLVDNAIPLNAGCLRPITIRLREGSLLAPVSPAAVVAGNVEVSQAIVSCLLLALGRTAASQTTMNNFTFGDDDYQYYETLAGGTGAGIDNQNKPFAGCDAVHSHMTNSRLTDIEVLEQQYPVLLQQFGIRSHSGGRGQYVGGNGLIRELLFLKDMEVSVLSNSRIIAPKGLSGGGDGQVGKNLHITCDDQFIEKPSRSSFKVSNGERLKIETPGGGGYLAE